MYNIKKQQTFIVFFFLNIVFYSYLIDDALPLKRSFCLDDTAASRDYLYFVCFVIRDVPPRPLN